MIEFWELELRNKTLNDPEQWGLFSSVEKAQEFVHDWIREKCPDWDIKWTEVFQHYDWLRSEGRIEGKQTYFAVTKCGIDLIVDKIFDDDCFYSYMYECCITTNGDE